MTRQADAGNALQLWVFDTDALGSVPESARREVLDDSERQREARYHFARHALQFAASRYWLRVVLAASLDVHPRDIAFDHGEFGKPSLKCGAGLHFSVSHTDGMTLIATGPTPIGVDVEKVGVWNASVCRPPYFQPHDLERIAQCDAGARDLLCWSIWTCKEAVLKATGHGLRAIGRMALRDDTAVCNEYAFSTPSQQDAAWRLIQLELGDGYVGALAVVAKGPAPQVILRSRQELTVHR